MIDEENTPVTPDSAPPTMEYTVVGESDWMAEETAIPAEVQAEIDLRLLRAQRDTYLQACDWTQGADVPDVIKLAWQPYRQALRDITVNYSSLADVVWPDQPA
jgi:hypothetical protein